MTTAVAIGGALLGGSLVAGLVFLRTRPSIMLGHLERQLSALRGEIADLRAAQEHLGASLERRMDDLEQVTAGAAVEARIASEAVLGGITDGPSSNDDHLRLGLSQQREDAFSDLLERIALPSCAAATSGRVGSASRLSCWVDAPGALDALTTAEPSDP